MIGPHSLLAMAAMNLAIAVFLALTAREVSKRRLSLHTRTAGTAFLVSWWALAIMVSTDAARILLAWSPHPDIVLYSVLARVKILATGVMIAGFGYYVAYLATGRRSLGVPILLFAASHAFLFLFLLESRSPLTVISGNWGSAMLFEHPPLDLFGLTPVALMYYFAPPVLLSLAFLSLIYRYNDKGQRMRAAATGAFVIAYHATGFILFSPGMDLNHIINPIMLFVVVIAALFAWRLHRQPLASVNPPGGPTAYPQTGDGHS